MISDNKKVNIDYTLFTIVVSVFVVLLLSINTIKKERAFSDIERRNLKTYDTADIYILDDDFSKNLENVLVDQFVFRDAYIKIKSLFDIITCKNYAGGVYILSDRYIEDEAKLDYDRLAYKSSSMLGEFNDLDADVFFALFPNAYNIDNEKLPIYAKKSYQDTVFELLDEMYKKSNIKFLDMRDTVKKIKDKGDNVYYKTDHHMTSEAMYDMKNDILKALSIDDKREYEKVKVSDDFQGSLVSKSGVFKDIKDDIYVYMDTRPIRYEMFDYGEQKMKASIYDFSKVDSYDEYLVFVGNNSKLISIKTENYDKKRLLLIKDSYANCFVSYLLPYYSTIDIVDPRYVSDIKELVSYDEYDDILFFYNLNTYIE